MATKQKITGSKTTGSKTTGGKGAAKTAVAPSTAVVTKAVVKKPTVAKKAPAKNNKATLKKIAKAPVIVAMPAKKALAKVSATKAAAVKAKRVIARTGSAKPAAAKASAKTKPAIASTATAKKAIATPKPAAARHKAAKPAAAGKAANRLSAARVAVGNTTSPKRPKTIVQKTKPPKRLKAGPAKTAVIKAAPNARVGDILTPEALAFLAELHRNFNDQRLALLKRRATRQKHFDRGGTPDFLAETRSIREDDWSVAPIPADLLDRRVEITGPVDRKMIINALNSGAKVFMADFEDATSPVFANLLGGQINLKDLWAGKIEYTDAKSGKEYRLGPDPAKLMVRPRGWHLPEKHVEVDGVPMSGALFDFGLYCFHSAAAQIAAGATPAFYLPKMEGHLEARLWNNVFSFAESRLGIASGTLKATVLIETLPAAFEMDEILYELREHIIGLNCGRWDYIFSFIKRLGRNPKYLTPDRAVMGMGKAFLAAYSALLIKTCHRRGAFAMGGMAAQIPNRKDAVANAAAMVKVQADKEREATNGHDGTWVAHPDLVPVAMEIFNRLMPGANQLSKLREDVKASQRDLLEVHEGARTEAGLRENIRCGVQYIEAWLRGLGAVPLYNLMEDAATAEISRAQVWQWLYHKARLDDGRTVTPALFKAVMADEMAKVAASLPEGAYTSGRFAEAEKLFRDMSLAKTCAEFLTLPAYELLE